MKKGRFDNEPDFTAQEALELARGVWTTLPNTAGIFFEGYEQKWYDEFDNHCFADLLNGLGLIAEEPQYQKNGDKIGIGIYYKYVVDAGELRKRHEVGVSRFCQERTHIGKYFGVWHFAKGTSMGTGTCWLSEQVVADHCGLTHDTAGRAVDWLVVQGWLEVVVAPRPGKRGTYRPIDHKEWVERQGYGQCLLQYRRK